MAAGTAGAEDGSMSCVLDPTEREEMVMVGALTVVLNQHGELCGHTGMTPLTAAHRVRAISLPRGGRGM